LKKLFEKKLKKPLTFLFQSDIIYFVAFDAGTKCYQKSNNNRSLKTE